MGMSWSVTPKLYVHNAKTNDYYKYLQLEAVSVIEHEVAFVMALHVE